SWHTAGSLVMPANVTALRLPPYSPELNPVERLWHYLREHHWSNRVYGGMPSAAGEPPASARKSSTASAPVTTPRQAVNSAKPYSFVASGVFSSPGLDSCEWTNRTASVTSLPTLAGSNSTRKAKRPGSAGNVPTSYQVRTQPSTPNRITRAASPA